MDGWVFDDRYVQGGRVRVESGEWRLIMDWDYDWDGRMGADCPLTHSRPGQTRPPFGKVCICRLRGVAHASPLCRTHTRPTRVSFASCSHTPSPSSLTPPFSAFNASTECVSHPPSTHTRTHSLPAPPFSNKNKAHFHKHDRHPQNGKRMNTGEGKHTCVHE